MLLNLGASTFLFSIVSNNFNSFNNTWHKPVVEAGVAVVRSTLRYQVSVRIMPQVFYARRNRRNSPSMARFLLASASMPRHFCALKHNSTDTKQLRYSPARQHCLPHHQLTPPTLRYNVPVLTCGSDGTALPACTWEAQNLRRFPLTSSPCEASPTYSSPFVIWPPGCVQAHLPPASVSYPAHSEA